MKFLIVWVSIACFVTCSSGESGKKYKIAYNVSTKVDSLGYDVFVMNTDGSEKKNITKNKDVAWTYYAYKNHLYFVSDRDTLSRYFFIYQTDCEGKSPRKISNLRVEDSYFGSRKNGTELIVSARIDKNNRYQLFILNTVNGDFRQITNDTSALYRDPIFSPDGKKIICAYKPNRLDRNMPEELVMMNDDGTELFQLTHYPKSDTTAPWHAYHSGPPRWNKKENFISYQSFQNGKYSLFAVSPNGQKQWKLIENHTQDEGWHDWSSDGNWITFDVSNKEQTQYHIAIMNWRTKELRILTDSTYKYQQSPVFIED